MRRSLVTPERALVVTALLMGVLSVLPLRVTAAVAGPPARLVNLLLVPLQQPLHGLGAALRGTDEPELYGDDADQLREDLALARTLIERYREELRQAREDLARLTMMAEHLQLRGVRMIDARVARYSGQPTNPTLTINRGSADGIAPGQVVVWETSLIGEVTDVATRTAEVALITAPHTQMSVVIAPANPDAQRRVREQIQIASDLRSFYVDIDPKQKPVEVGDLAMLTDEMGRYAREAIGWVVGQVVEITDETSDPLLLKRVVIQPLIDPAQLRQVTVIQPVE